MESCPALVPRKHYFMRAKLHPLTRRNAKDLEKLGDSSILS
jgi:hypothetical protein